MRKLSVLLGTFFAFACVGCSEDRNESAITGTIEILNATTTTITNISTTLNNAVRTAKNEQKPLDIAKIDDALKRTEELKKQAEALQRLRASADSRRDPITDEQREEYAAKHKNNLATAVADLDAAQKKLDVAFREAEAAADDVGKDALLKLRNKLEEAQKEFEVLTKRQS